MLKFSVILLYNNNNNKPSERRFFPNFHHDFRNFLVIPMLSYFWWTRLFQLRSSSPYLWLSHSHLHIPRLCLLAVSHFCQTSIQGREFVFSEEAHGIVSVTSPIGSISRSHSAITRESFHAGSRRCWSSCRFDTRFAFLTDFIPNVYSSKFFSFYFGNNSWFSAWFLI